MLNRTLSALTCILLFTPFFIFAQQTVLIDLNDFYPERIESAGFTLDSEQKISISAAAITPYSSRYNPLTEAWILDSETRDVVWLLDDAEDVERDGKIVLYEDQLTLKPGNYEVYYSTFRNPNNFNFWGDNRRPGFFERLFGDGFDDDGEWHFRRREYKQLFIKISGNGTPQTDEDIAHWIDNKKGTALIDFSKMRDDEFMEKILEVSKPIELRVYSIGEARVDGEYDFGWIVNLENRDKVWELNYRNSAHAGGAKKNRLKEETVSLEPGKYKIVYVTDDSHSYRRWNSAPPYDPSFWGLTVWLEDSQQKGNIAVKDVEEVENKNVIVDFKRVRDNEYLSKGFTLSKPLTLHIYALGEGSDGDMYDYGWIIDAKTRKRVWEMKYYKTEQAGGAHKNRLFDGTVTLDPGNYIAYYVTDGSHSYRRWNSGHPFDEKSWGLRISVLDDNYNEGDFTEYNEEDDAAVLVRITRVGDYDRARASFTLDKGQEVHVYAIGEGLRNEMFDYAWIENANTGRIEWEMTYRKTERAGGARKNRLFDDNIYLEAGEYEVFYETDDSHSYADWNDSPPDDPVNWGVIITRLEK